MRIFFRLRPAVVNGLRELQANKVRSLLSMSGIILGVASLVAMVTVVEGMMGNFKQFVDGMGGLEKIMVEPQSLPPEQRHLAALSKSITLRDVDQIRARLPLITNISPEVRVGWETIVSEGREAGASILGCTPDYLPVAKRWIDPGQGRFISDLDILYRSDVAVLGASTAKDLFPPNADPLGKFIRVRGKRFLVVGLLNQINGLHGWRNGGVFIPITTATSKFTANTNLTALGMRIADANSLHDAVSQVERSLLQMHHGLKDFRIDTNEETLESFRKTQSAFKLSLGGVAAISLLIGGIGIMNVMLASINERIREIGVRKAVGARGSDLFLQFLAEAAVISVMGGIIGLSVSMGIVWLMNYILTQAIPSMAVGTLNWKIMAQGLGFSVIVGLVAGVYPALRAAKLDPIEALRHE
jgi:ABC-type antimicrobial peptide transport system permease subunit